MHNFHFPGMVPLQQHQLLLQRSLQLQQFWPQELVTLIVLIGQVQLHSG